MVVYIDTSAFYAILYQKDENYTAASKIWADLVTRGDDLVSNNYVLVETIALLQRRLGLEAVKAFQEDIVPILSIDWISETKHQTAIQGLFIAGRRYLSLVDCTSFETMRRLGIHSAFAFDPHFNEQGFETLS
ncbi:MAG TPA: PIN domain-containing protein [Anaerolineales bacterium]|nr:PIN domain-containing protein [Anaerolineales bacterium]